MKSMTPKRLLASLAVVGAAAAVAGLGTFATFTSSTSASHTVASGTVSIALGASGAANRLNIGAANLVPGDTVQRAADLNNNGTGTLDAPNSPGATQVNCRTNKSPEVKLDWTASESSYAASYEIERRTGINGSFEAVATVSASQTSYTDKSAALNYSTTYYYRVATVYRSWTATSILASVKTLSKSCA